MFQISKAAIKNYKVGGRIPHCGIELRQMSDDSTQRLWHKVDIKGISHGYSFHLRYCQPSSLVPQVGEIIT